jgi:hypothetical protein
VNIKKFILAWIVTAILFLVLDMLFGALGGFLTANITGAPIQGPAGIESKIFTGFLFEIINGFILVLVYAAIHPSIPGKGLVKGIGYGLIVWALRVLMWAFSTYMMFDVSTVLLAVTTILGLIEVLILCIVIAVIYKDP